MPKVVIKDSDREVIGVEWIADRGRLIEGHGDELIAEAMHQAVHGHGIDPLIDSEDQAGLSFEIVPYNDPPKKPSERGLQLYKATDGYLWMDGFALSPGDYDRMPCTCGPTCKSILEHPTTCRCNACGLAMAIHEDDMGLSRPMTPDEQSAALAGRQELDAVQEAMRKS